MNERLKHIADQARQLTPEEQAELMNQLDAMRQDQHEMDPMYRAELLAECERRWKRYKSGESKFYSWEEIRAELDTL